VNCPTCLGPMAWSEDRRRLWCAVYGDHPAIEPYRTNVVHLCMEAPNNTRNAIWKREDRARRRAQGYPPASTLRTQGNSHGCAPSDPQPGDRTIAV
jgi:hypothetical protein